MINIEQVRKNLIDNAVFKQDDKWGKAEVVYIFIKGKKKYIAPNRWGLTKEERKRFNFVREQVSIYNKSVEN